MRGNHEREEIQHCDVATGKRRQPRDREAAGAPNGPKPKDAAAADETKNRVMASYSACEKKLTSAQEIKNYNNNGFISHISIADTLNYNVFTIWFNY
jgi:hypothetical protein